MVLQNYERNPQNAPEGIFTKQCNFEIMILDEEIIENTSNRDFYETKLDVFIIKRKISFYLTE